MAVIEYGKPLEELDLSEPVLRPGTVLLRVEACGVCFSDVKTARGVMPFSATLPLPHVPGHELCARVVETSPPGLFEPGELVVAHHYWPCGRCRRCRAGDESLCLDLQGWLGFTHPGGFQERLVVPADRLLRLPIGIEPVAAAAISCALGTAYRATVTRGRAVAGSTVAVIGLGGVGIHALQVAAASGANAVGLDTSERAVEVARGLGLTAADARSFTRETAELDSVVDEGFDTVIVTAAATAAYEQAANLVRNGGRIVAVGYAIDSVCRLETPRLALGEVHVLGSRYVSRSELERAIELIERGLVRTIVDSVRPLDEVNEAFAALEQGEIVGRTVLRVAS